jgi:hypothetical protein
MVCEDHWEGRGEIWQDLCLRLNLALSVMHVVLAGGTQLSLVTASKLVGN